MTFNPASPGAAVPVTSSPSGLSAGAPSVAHASLSGIAKGRLKLSFTLSSRGHAGALRAITVALPAGLSFSSSKRNLAHGVAVKVRGKGVRFTAKVSHGKLTITLKLPATSVQVTISSPAIAVSRALAKKVKSGTVKKLSVRVTATNTHRTTATTTLKLKAS